jgi:hypothetical protein
MDIWTSSKEPALRRSGGNDFGLELRVLHGDELVESRLSRVGEAPLLLIADESESNPDRAGMV